MLHLLLLALLVCLKIAFFIFLALFLVGALLVALGIYDWLRRRRASELLHRNGTHGGKSSVPARPPRLQSRRDVENIVYLRDATEEEIEDAVVFMSDHRRRKRQ